MFVKMQTHPAEKELPLNLLQNLDSSVLEYQANPGKPGTSAVCWKHPWLQDLRQDFPNLGSNTPVEYVVRVLPFLAIGSMTSGNQVPLAL